MDGNGVNGINRLRTKKKQSQNFASKKTESDERKKIERTEKLECER